jgi:hypothetical protein
LATTLEGGTDVEEFYRVPRETLTLPYLFSEVERGTAMGPKQLLDQSRILGDFVIGECHGKTENNRSRGVKPPII